MNNQLNIAIGNLNNNINLVTIIKVLISTIIIFLALLIFTYIYYRINNQRNLMNNSNKKFNWWPLIFPYITTTILWIIIYLTQQKSQDNIWIYFNIYYLCFNFIISIILVWWYIFANSIVYIVMICLTRYSEISIFNNLHFLIGFILIFGILCIISFFISLFKKRRRYLLYISILVPFIIFIALNYTYIYVEENIQVTITTVVIVTSFLTTLLSLYLNNKILSQTNAFLILSRNIQYDYTYFFNKANMLSELKDLINKNKLNFLCINTFNFIFENNDENNLSRNDLIIKKNLKRIISEIKEFSYIAFTTFENNFSISFYGKKNNNLNYLLEIKNKFNKLLDKINQKYQENTFNIYCASSIYGLENNIIESTIKETDAKLKLKINSNKEIENVNFILDNKNDKIKEEIGKFVRQNYLLIELDKKDIDDTKYYYVSLRFLKPVHFNQNYIYNEINKNPYKNYIKRYIFYVAIKKFINLKNDNNILILKYPILEFLNNKQTLINIINLLDQYKISIKKLIINLNIDEEINENYSKIIDSIRIAKNFGFKISLSMPLTDDAYKWIIKNPEFINLFDLLTLNNNSIIDKWPRSYNNKISEFLNNINSKQKIIYY